MSQELHIGNRVIIKGEEEEAKFDDEFIDDEFYGIIVKKDRDFCNIRLFYGWKVQKMATYLQKVDPYDIRYVMPGDEVRDKKDGAIHKVWDVRPHIVGLSSEDNFNSFWKFYTRKELKDKFSISPPVGVESEENYPNLRICVACEGSGCRACGRSGKKLETQEDEWEEVRADELQKGNICKRKENDNQSYLTVNPQNSVEIISPIIEAKNKNQIAFVVKDLKDSEEMIMIESKSHKVLRKKRKE